MKPLLVLALLTSVAAGQPGRETRHRHERLQLYEARIESSDLEVRLSVVQALGGETGHFPTSLLMKALQDESDAVRLAAMRSILHVGRWRKRAAPLLAKLLNDENPAVGERARETLLAMEVLGDLSTPYLVSVARRSEEPSIALVRELGLRQDDVPLVAPELGALLAREDPRELEFVDVGQVDVHLVFWVGEQARHWRHAALLALIRLGPGAVAARRPVVAMTRHSDPRTRGLALRALAVLAPWDEETDRILVRVMTDDEVPYARACAFVEAAFLSIRRGTEGKPLAESVRSRLRGEGSEDVRAIALAALELREPPPLPKGNPAPIQGSSEEQGIAELSHDSEEVRIHGANLLAEAGASERAVRALRAVLVPSRDLPVGVVEEVDTRGMQLFLHTQGLVPRPADRSGVRRADVGWALGRSCRPIPHLHSRLAAVKALGSYGPSAASAVPELLRMLEDDAWRLREAAWKALARIDARAVPEAALRDAQHDRYREVREAASGLRRLRR